ncbi:MAG: hypothetical protein ACLGGX_03380 [Bdellovibrionia bacterium]
MTDLEEVLKQSQEVSFEVAVQWLGITPKALSDYLKAKQIQGVKVGEEWFIQTASLLAVRPLGVLLNDFVLPEVENPLSRHQQEKINQKNGSDKRWDLKKNSKRSPTKLNCFVRLQEAWDLLQRIKESIFEEDYRFFSQELLTIGDEIGAGYYSFGVVKRKLYGRARVRAGRIVSRAVLLNMPQGFFLSLCNVVEAIVFLCRKLERKEGAHVKDKASTAGA